MPRPGISKFFVAMWNIRLTVISVQLSVIRIGTHSRDAVVNNRRSLARYIYFLCRISIFINLSVSNFFDRIHIYFLANAYRSFFNKISRHHHCDSPEVWQERLDQAGFEMIRYWHYFSPGAFHTLEWGHYFGLPSLICHFLTGKWILFPTKWNLWLTEKICRRL